ncbi:MAG: uracil-DNA glycosylase [bacterium]|nr:uracil-DNA glycosylase [bacterium]
MSKTDELRKIKEEIISGINLPLYEYRTENRYFPVIGEGSHDAKVMFVGEAPGLNEAKQGRPFCGSAGRMLDKLLMSIDLKRENVYITNIVKDRPPENRDPSDAEIEAYAPFLMRQIEAMKPEAVCALGRHSMKFIMQEYGLLEQLSSISNLHGKIFNANGFKFIPLYHPAVAIYNGNMKKVLEEDFKMLKKFI